MSHRTNPMRAPALAALALAAAAGLLLAACAVTPGSSSEYQGGYARDDAAGVSWVTPEAAVMGMAVTVGTDAQAMCSFTGPGGPDWVGQNAPAGEPVPASELPPPDNHGAGPLSDWIDGCTAGYATATS